MRRLRDSVLYLLVHLTIVFNIERLDVGEANVTNLATPFYVLTIIAVVMILYIRWLKTVQQPVLILLWTAVYFAMKMALTSQRPLLGGIYTYLSFTELGLLVIAVLLTQNLALNIEEFEQAVKNFAFTNINKINRIQEAHEKIQAEIYRSRRFQRPLSIIVLEKDLSNIQANINKIVQEAQQALLEEYISAAMIRELTAQLRQTDFLLEHDKSGRWIIISPDTDHKGIKNLIDRLGSLTQSTVLSIKFGAATFPSNGLTFEQLLEQAEMNLQLKMNGRINIDSHEKVENNQTLNIP